MDKDVIETNAIEGLKEGYLNCAQCEAITPDCDASDTYDGLVCEKCFEDYVECEDCSNHIHRDNSNTSNGSDYCEDCYAELPFCEHCEERDSSFELSTVHCRHGEQLWCESCTQNGAWDCERCEETHSDYYSSYHIRGMGNICESCEENADTFECCECNDRWVFDSCANPDDDSEEYVCNQCDRGGKRYIKSYNHKPTPIFKLATNQHKKVDQLYFGIELEVEQKDSSVKVSKMAEDISTTDTYYLKSDGSLNNGFEIVTHPMTFEYIQEVKLDIFKTMLDKLIKAGYRSYDSSTCGIHIHLSKKCFTTWQLFRFIKFFIDNKQFVIDISQREIEQLERWAAIENDNDDTIIYKAKKKCGSFKRYSAINVQNDSTIEIRIFRGTLNYLSFLKNIEFCYALFNFSRDSKETTISAFKEYIEQSHEYAMLKKFIKTKNL